MSEARGEYRSEVRIRAPVLYSGRGYGMVLRKAD